MRIYKDEFTDSAVVAGSARAYGGRRPAAEKSLRAQAGSANVNYVRLEIRSDTLYNLINDKALVIEDLRGLDRQAQRWVRQRLLDALLPQ